MSTPGRVSGTQGDETGEGYETDSTVEHMEDIVNYVRHDAPEPAQVDLTDVQEVSTDEYEVVLPMHEQFRPSAKRAPTQPASVRPVAKNAARPNVTPRVELFLKRTETFR